LNDANAGVQANNSVPRISDSGEAWETVAQQVVSPSAFQPFVDQQRFDSPRIRRSEAFAQYARGSFTPGRGMLDAALDLTRRIYVDFKYDTLATNVDTTPEEAFAGKAGVCQDFAQVAVACIRSIGLPARYVSGYLRTIPPLGKPALVGADESHAWFSVYSGAKYGWVGFDPTNGTLAGTDHIPISIGRDYGDISPMRGVVLGGGPTTLKVSVDVQPVSDVQQQAMQQ
jgi:transglutaminase-like putative cysteine protease